MLSGKIKSLFSQRGYISLSKGERASYEKALIDLGIPLGSSFAEFNLSTIGPTFAERGYELYNVCWFKIYSNDLDYAIESAHGILQLPDEYLPLDNFEAEEGFFYNRNTEEVLKLSIGPDLEDFQSGKLHPQWKDFNSFLEWFFEV